MTFETPDSFVAQLGRNKILVSMFFAWFTAQILKVLIGYFSALAKSGSLSDPARPAGGRTLRFNFKWLIRSGGMPSSHVALSACLTTSVGFHYGFDSGLFAIAMGFTAITMFDAQGIRRHSGRQATILNRILEDIYENKGLQEARLKELVGHTPVEVYAGGLLGILVAAMFYARG